MEIEAGTMASEAVAKSQELVADLRVGSRIAVALREDLLVSSRVVVVASAEINAEEAPRPIEAEDSLAKEAGDAEAPKVANPEITPLLMRTCFSTGTRLALRTRVSETLIKFIIILGEEQKLIDKAKLDKELEDYKNAGEAVQEKTA